MPFVKLDCGIIHSSLWAESSDTKICWITLLLLADQNGFVRAAPSAIAREAGIPAEVARKSIALFCSPDNESRSPENKGKRIERVEGGFHILNYEKYRERDYTNAERQKRWRESQKSNVTSVTEALPVTERNTSRSRVQKQSTEELEIYLAYPMKVGKPDALRAIKKAISRGTSPAILLERTKAFAKARNGDVNFCPNPATWFNQERFNDDPATWSPKSNGQPKSRPKERAPSYPKMTESRQASDEEYENARRIAAEEKAKLKAELGR